MASESVLPLQVRGRNREGEQYTSHGVWAPRISCLISATTQVFLSLS